MKSFRKLLAILVIFSACPIFGADNDGEREGIIERLIGPGSLTRGSWEYITTTQEARNCKDSIIGGSLSALGIAASVLFTDYVSDIPEIEPIAKYLFVGSGVVGGICSGTLLNFYIFKDDLSLSYRGLCLTRDIQRARAHKEVDNENIKGYLGELLDDIAHGGNMGLPNEYYQPRMKFFREYRGRFNQLKTCVEEVLTAEGQPFRKVDDHFGLECIGDPREALGPLCVYGADQGSYLRFKLLHNMLHDNNEEEEDAEDNNPEDLQEALNNLLGYIGQNIKPARR